MVLDTKHTSEKSALLVYEFLEVIETNYEINDDSCYYCDVIYSIYFEYKYEDCMSD